MYRRISAAKSPSFFLLSSNRSVQSRSSRGQSSNELHGCGVGLSVVVDQFGAAHAQCFGFAQLLAGVQPPVIGCPGYLQFLAHPVHRVLAGLGFDEGEDCAYFLLFEAK